MVAGDNSNVIECNLAICWNLPSIAYCTRYDKNIVISKNQFSNGTISRVYPNTGILRDFTPESRRYLAGLIDGDGCIGKTSVEITLHTDEKELLFHIQTLVGGGSVSKRKGAEAWRYRVFKNRRTLLDNVAPYIATEKKLDSLSK
jgi:hypothetical protein